MFRNGVIGKGERVIRHWEIGKRKEEKEKVA